MPSSRRLALPIILATTLAGASPLASHAQQGPATQPGKQSRIERADADMRDVLAKLMELGAKPIHTLSVAEARRNASPADAVTALMQARGIAAPRFVAKHDIRYPAAQGDLAARVYFPQRPAGSTGEPRQPLPVIVYFHGGGWVIADIETYDASATALAERTGAIVVSVDYRRAPEHRLPAAHLDAFAAYQWVSSNARQWGGDPARVAVAGESAGGNLAINVAIMARDQGVRPPVHMLLVYPVAGTDTETASYTANAEAMPLGRADMLWFLDKVLARPEDRQSPMLDLVGRADLRGLPSATVITAEIDPLRSEGRALAEKLAQAGVPTSHRDFEGVAHEFFGMAALVADADRAQDLAAGELRRAFEQGAATGGGTGTGGQGR